MNPCGEEHVRMLLDARADLNAKNSHGQTPFSMVSEIQGRQNIAKMVDPKRDELDPAKDLFDQLGPEGSPRAAPAFTPCWPIPRSSAQQDTYAPRRGGGVRGWRDPLDWGSGGCRSTASEAPGPAS
eukprot:CAMPEP_0176251136 /NCGR_PEP_ID=MMETSP0121_2-20121125/34844_1 /TAXON_ID=160619 /ORGANISM="Kryptoperidinium foliaceum, Strain CCMP 1326" /LENGTH=125 /DNA_ID=CAMNT_0017590871 /DNA_START=99 /DNA_END=477 /DNA_ORIENTATION=+